MTTTESNITKDMTAVEAANLLEKLEEGHQAAWLSTHEAQWQTAEYQSRFENAAEVDGVFHDVMWETVENGMRRPGEPVEEFAERAESEARLTDARKAGAEPSADPITQRTDAGITPQRAGDSQNASVDRLLNDVSTPEGQAYARAFSDTAAAHMKELRERDHLPEPDHTPGAPHPDPFLADRGWHVNEHGIYTRRPEPQAVIGRLVEVTADLDRVRARADGRLAADHARVWARGITVTDPGHAKTARRLRQEFRQPRTPAPAGDLIRDLADYDRAFGLVTTGDGEVAK